MLDKLIGPVVGVIAMVLAAFVIVFSVVRLSDAATFDDKVAYECVKHDGEFERFTDEEGLSKYECLKD